MAITCTANSLANAATCITQQDSHLLSAMQVYLLCQLATGQTVTCDLQTLATNSRCLSDSLSSHELEAVKVYLLCAMASGGFSGGQILYYTANPNAEGLTPSNQALPAIAATKDGTGAVYTWNTTTLTWN